MKNAILFLQRHAVLIIVAIISVYLFYYCISGFQVYSAVKYAFLTDKPYDEYISRFMTQEVFESLNSSSIVEDHKFSKKWLKLCLLFSINDIFDSGIVWMKYSFEMRDRHTDEIITGSGNVPITLYLKREGWHWKIVKKDEAP